MKNTKKGFTLVELLVVIAILAILASVAVVGYSAFLDKANESAAKSEAHQIEMAIESALMVDDVVLVKADDATTANVIEAIYAIKGTNGTITFANALPEGVTAADDDISEKKKEQILQQIEEQEKAHDSSVTSNSSHTIKKGKFGDFSSW